MAGRSARPFGAQTAYFSDCILTGASPEADGAEGLADVRALRAIEEAAKTGRVVKIGGTERNQRPNREMIRKVATTNRRLVLKGGAPPLGAGFRPRQTGSGSALVSLVERLVVGGFPLLGRVTLLGTL